LYAALVAGPSSRRAIPCGADTARARVGLADTREELLRVPHNEPVRKEFVRERGPRPKDVAELKSKDRVKYSDEQGKESYKLFALYQQYGFLGWIYG
jgi:hypothetical protein